MSLLSLASVLTTLALTFFSLSIVFLL